MDSALAAAVAARRSGAAIVTAAPDQRGVGAVPWPPAAWACSATTRTAAHRHGPHGVGAVPSGAARAIDRRGHLGRAYARRGPRRQSDADRLTTQGLGIGRVAWLVTVGCVGRAGCQPARFPAIVWVAEAHDEPGGPCLPSHAPDGRRNPGSLGRSGGEGGPSTAPG